MCESTINAPTTRPCHIAAVAVAVLATVGQSSFRLASATSPANKPDVLIVVCDDLNPFYLGFAGDPDVETPRLDALARQSTVFSNCYTQSTVCMPARTSLITGLYPHNTGCWGNASDLFVNAELTSMFRDFERTGYSATVIGKTHWFAGPGFKREFPSLIDFFHGIGIESPREVATTFGSRTGAGAYQDFLRAIGKFEAQAKDLMERLRGNQYVVRPSLLEPEETCDWMMTDLAVESIRQAPKGKPFVLYVGYSNPHSPFDPSGRYASMYDPEKLSLRGNVQDFEKYGTVYSAEETRRARAAYLGKITFVDDLVGRIEQALRERGTWNNTIVVFTADHGLAVGEHGNLTKGRFWEEVARVPLVIRVPGVTDDGLRSHVLVQMFDIYPTLVELAGGAVSPHVLARSLVPVLREPNTQVRDAVLCEIAHNGSFDYMVRLDQYKWYVEGGDEQLFDLDSDPLEQQSLIRSEDHQATAQALRDRLRQFLMTQQIHYGAGYKPLVQRVKETAQNDGQ